ncbi:MAG: ribosome-associated translation inhibitor RaiA [Alphaproteobacteria bacterium]|nr:ribosome-associated translation inhibitor RaiA [Alphaproteobacteria bacterium]
MQLSVKGKQVDVGDTLRQHVEKSLSEIVSKYFNAPLDAQVTFSREAHMFRADIQVHARRGITLQSSALSGDAYPAFDEAAGRMATRLRRYKSRLRDHHQQQQQDRAEQEAIIASSFVLHGHQDTHEEEIAENPVVVAEMTTPIDTLAVSEAVMRLDLGDLPALMFRNRANGGLNMIYRRTDGHIGWIDPSQNVAVNKPAQSAASGATKPAAKTAINK